MMAQAGFQPLKSHTPLVLTHVKLTASVPAAAHVPEIGSGPQVVATLTTTAGHWHHAGICSYPPPNLDSTIKMHIYSLALAIIGACPDV